MIKPEKIIISLFLLLFIYMLMPVKISKGDTSGKLSSRFKAAVVNNNKTYDFSGINIPNTDISIDGDNIPLRPLIIGIAYKFHINYVLSSAVNGAVTIHMNNIHLPLALRTIFKAGDLSYSVNNGILFIGPKASLNNNYTDYKINLHHIQAKNVLPVLTPVLPTGAKAYASPHGNSLFVYDLPSNIKEIRQIVKSMDVKKRIVLLNAKIVDINNNFVRNLGIAWSLVPEASVNTGSTTTAIGQPTGFEGAVTSGAGKNVGIISLGTAWQNFGLLSAQLSAGQQLGWDKVVESPSVSVLSGQPATINSSLLEYYVAYTAGSGSSTTTSSGAGGTTVIAQQPVVSTLQTITIGITLTVTPIVESADDILLNVTLTYSFPSSANGIDGFPAVNNKSVATVVSVKNNATLVIGGLMALEKSHQNNGIPILSQIPILGYLFSTRNKSVSKEQLMLFISPEIIN